MSGLSGERMPSELKRIDAALRSVEMEPRASLGPEIAGRFAAGERARPRTGASGGRFRFWAAGAVAAALLAALMVLPTDEAPPALGVMSRVDRCCQDLDGGGAADDGVLVESVAGHQVNRVVLYEDSDHVGHWSPASPIRYERRGAPTYQAQHPSGELVIREFCCDDYDGGRRSDDGILVVLSRANDVLLATIYERAAALEHVRLR